MEKKNNMEYHIDIGRCPEGHYVARVRFKIDGKPAFESSDSPCYETQGEAINAAHVFTKLMGPAIIEAHQNSIKDALAERSEVEQYLH